MELSDETDRTVRRRPVDQGDALLDELPVPQRTVLLRQRDDRAVLAAARRPSRVADLLGETHDDRDAADPQREQQAHPLEMAGNLGAAAAHYDTAARRTTSLPEQQHLTGRAARLRDGRG